MVAASHEPRKLTRSQEWKKYPEQRTASEPRISVFKTLPNAKDLTMDIQLNPGDRVIINTQFGSIVLTHQTKRVRVAMQGTVAGRGDEPYGLLSSPEDMFRPQNELVIELEQSSAELKHVKEDEYRRKRSG